MGLNFLPMGGRKELAEYDFFFSAIFPFLAYRLRSQLLGETKLIPLSDTRFLASVLVMVGGGYGNGIYELERKHSQIKLPQKGWTFKTAVLRVK